MTDKIKICSILNLDSGWVKIWTDVLTKEYDFVFTIYGKEKINMDNFIIGNNAGEYTQVSPHILKANKGIDEDGYEVIDDEYEVFAEEVHLTHEFIIKYVAELNRVSEKQYEYDPHLFD